MAHSPRSGKGGRRDETGGTIRAGTTSGLRRGNQSAGSGTALWDRPADGGEDAGVLGAAWLSAEPSATAGAPSFARSRTEERRLGRELLRGTKYDEERCPN